MQSISELLQARASPSKTKRQSARSKGRRPAFERDLAERYMYQLSKARNDDERAQIDQEYATQLKAGPEYIHSSKFSVAFHNTIDKAKRKAILAAFDEVRDWSWRNRRKRGQAVSINYREVLRVILNFALKYGRAFPSLARIAKLVRCCVRTVQNALQWLKLWGFLDWERRLKRVPGILGANTQQTSNGYRVLPQGLSAIGRRVFNFVATGNHYHRSPIGRRPTTNEKPSETS